MLKQQNEMAESELQYVIECFKKIAFDTKEEKILETYCEYILKKENDKKNFISQLQKELENLKNDEDHCGMIVIAGIILAVILYLFSDAKDNAEVGNIMISSGIGIASLIAGELAYHKNKKNQENIYSDLDKANKELSVLIKSNEKILSFRQYNCEINKFIAGK